MLSEASLGDEAGPTSQLLDSSHALGWRTVLARSYLEPEAAEEFSRPASPDLLVVIQLAGVYRIESRRPSGWAAADYTPGSMGVTAPGRVPLLRWRPAGAGERARTLHLHLAADLLRETADALGRPRALQQLPDALHLDDAGVLAAGRALGAAATQCAPALAADSLAQALAAQLLARADGGPVVAAGALDQIALSQVVEFMHEHLGAPVSLDQLADIVHMSKYHFLRMFTRATGTTPHRYLVRLRMDRAAQLLRSSNYTVVAVSHRCGYSATGHFIEAFHRQFGVTPERYRREQQYRR